MLPKAGDLLRIQDRFYIVGQRNVEKCVFYCQTNIKRKSLRQDVYAYISDFMILDKRTCIIG